MAQALVTIGAFAVLSGLSVATLRHYDEIAPLQPAEVDRGRMAANPRFAAYLSGTVVACRTFRFGGDPWQ